jgi:hypothetical protein
MSKLIIGIHGLSNKPPQKVLKQWWKASIQEGLKLIGHPGVFFRFELVYWADVLHPEPLDHMLSDEKNPFHIEFPYVPAPSIEKKEPNEFRKKVLDFLEKKMDKIFLKRDLSVIFSSITDIIIRHYFKDLDLYYSATCKGENNEEVLARDIIRSRLEDIIRKHRKKQILLISHSMGSIIAFEVLSRISKELKIDTFITAGSPLGQPYVMNKMFSELNDKSVKPPKLRTPDSIFKNWFNFSDLEDKVAMNYSLSDDYKKNQNRIMPIDKIVFNNYVYDQKRNPHKSYGYLRTPDMAEVIYQFLARDRSKFTFWFTNRFNEFLEKIRKKR